MKVSTFYELRGKNNLGEGLNAFFVVCFTCFVFAFVLDSLKNALRIVMMWAFLLVWKACIFL